MARILLYQGRETRVESCQNTALVDRQAEKIRILPCNNPASVGYSPTLGVQWVVMGS